MLKIPSKLSITISIGVSLAFFALCIGLAFYMPEFASLMIQAVNDLGITKVDGNDENIILGLAYVALVFITLIDILLFMLLQRVKGGKVFTPESVALIRGISWGCYLVAVVFCGLSAYFTFVALLVAFVAIFLGLCLRVVKNVIEEATEIKSENDLTV